MSLSKVRVVNLSVGEAFGFEECQNLKPDERETTITCNFNDSELLFISFQDFRERVVNVAGNSNNILLESLIKQGFYEERE